MFIIVASAGLDLILLLYILYDDETNINLLIPRREYLVNEETVFMTVFTFRKKNNLFFEHVG